MNSFYRTILKKSPDGYICHKIFGEEFVKIDLQRVEDTNDSFLKIFGLDLSNEPVKQVGDFLKASDINHGFSWDNHLRNSLDAQENLSTEFFYHPNNKWILLTSFIADGYLITFAKDISNTKKAEAQERKLLNYEMKKFTMIAEQSPMSVVITDVDGNIEYVNTKFCQSTGYSFREVEGCSPRILQSGQTSNEIYEELWQTISRGHEWQGAFINRKKNGDIYYEFAKIAPIMDDLGRIIQYVGIKEDITQRILAENAMMANGKRLSALLEVAQAFGSTIKMDKLLNIVITNSIQLLDMDTGVIYFVLGNLLDRVAILPADDSRESNAPKKFSISKCPLIQRCIEQKDILIINDLDSEGLTPEEKQVSLLHKSQSALAIPLVVEGEVLAVLVLGSRKKNRMLNPDDVEVCELLSSQASMAIKNAKLYKEVKRHASWYATYTNKLRVLNEELQIAKDKAEQSDRLKTAFLQNMSHEVRTPMNSILGFAELMRRDKSSENKHEFYLGHIINSGNLLMRIVDDIIHVSRIEAGDVIIKNEHVHPDLIVEEIYHKFAPRCSGEVKLIKENLIIKEDKLLETDGSRLSQVIESLVDNAVKFTKTGWIRFGYSASEDNKIHFFVEDTGVGVSNEKVSLIFKPFYQADMGANREFGGNGLGLTIASGIVKQMGSFLSVKSEPQIGSYFSFDLELSYEYSFR